MKLLWILILPSCSTWWQIPLLLYDFNAMSPDRLWPKCVFTTRDNPDDVTNFTFSDLIKLLHTQTETLPVLSCKPCMACVHALFDNIHTEKMEIWGFLGRWSWSEQTSCVRHREKHWQVCEGHPLHQQTDHCPVFYPSFNCYCILYQWHLCQTETQSQSQTISFPSQSRLRNPSASSGTELWCASLHRCH